MEKYKILLIDDDPAALDMISQALESRGYQVTTVDDDKAALDLISRKGFDLVLTDMVSYLDKLHLKRKIAQSQDQDDLRLFSNSRSGRSRNIF